MLRLGKQGKSLVVAAGRQPRGQGTGGLHTRDTGRAGGPGHHQLLDRGSRLHTTSQVRFRKQAKVTCHEPKNTQHFSFWPESLHLNKNQSRLMNGFCPVRGQEEHSHIDASVLKTDKEGNFLSLTRKERNYLRMGLMHSIHYGGDPAHI